MKATLAHSSRELPGVLMGHCLLRLHNPLFIWQGVSQMCMIDAERFANRWGEDHPQAPGGPHLTNKGNGSGS